VQSAGRSLTLRDNSANGNHQTFLLSIVIPIFNERKTLGEILRRVLAVPLAKEIILVDDGSKDGTRELLKTIENPPEVCVFYHSENRGKGAALKTGFLNAKGSIILVQDADLEYDPADYQRLIEPILADRADVVFGSRFLEAERRRSWHSFGNRLLTTVSNFFTNLNLTDMETCYKVFRRDTLCAITSNLKENRFGIEPELTAKVARRKYRIQEVSVHYAGRSYQEGKKIGWRDGLSALWCILRYWAWD